MNSFVSRESTWTSWVVVFCVLLAIALAAPEAKDPDPKKDDRQRMAESFQKEKPPARAQTPGLSPLLVAGALVATAVCLRQRSPQSGKSAG